MALYHKWDIKNAFAYVLQFFSLIFDNLGGVQRVAMVFYCLIIRMILYIVDKTIRFVPLMTCGLNVIR